jgi:hypothetical protein
VANAEHHPARWRRGVDLRALAGEHPQTDTAIRQICTVLTRWVSVRRAGRASKREDIAVAQRFQAGGKTGAIITATGCTIIIDIAWLDTGSAKGIVLQVERLRAVGFGRGRSRSAWITNEGLRGDEHEHIRLGYCVS